MTSPLNVDPNDLLVVAQGHLLLINRLGQAIDITPDVPQGPWPSQAGVTGMHGATTAVTAAMMTRLGQHSADLTQAASTYHGQEQTNTAALGKDGPGMFTSALKDVGGLLTGAIKETQGEIGSIGQVTAAAGASVGGALASSAGSLLTAGATAASKNTPHPPDPGTALATAPQTSPDVPRQQQQAT